MDRIFRDAVFVSGGVVERRRKERIKGYAKGVFQHAGNNSFENQTVDFQAWIGVDLDEPWLEVAVYHEIKAKDLEIIAPAVWLKKLERSSYRVCSDLLEFRKDLLLKIVANT